MELQDNPLIKLTGFTNLFGNAGLSLAPDADEQTGNYEILIYFVTIMHLNALFNYFNIKYSLVSILIKYLMH